jgi:hypothetical protein
MRASSQPHRRCEAGVGIPDVCRKITATVDEELVDLAHEFGEEKQSAVVNTALAEHVEQLGRLATLPPTS